MRQITVIIFTLLFLASCKKEQKCEGRTEQRIKGNIMSMTGPDSLRVGETAAVSLMVATKSDYCIQRAEGVIGSTYGNYITVEANLVHAGSIKSNSECGCYLADSIYTIVYFTPLTPGIYYFDMDPNASLPSVRPYTVVVYQ